MVHAFPWGIWPKVDVIAQRKFEYVYFEVAVRHFGH